MNAESILKQNEKGKENEQRKNQAIINPDDSGRRKISLAGI